jgi:hypothetical protein
MLLAASDASVHSKMFRLLWSAEELFTYVPPHPELEGEHLRSIDDGFTWCNFADPQGSFVPVFTSLKCAEYELRNLNQSDAPKPMIASMPAKVLFHFLNDHQTTARVIAAGGGRVHLAPEAVAALVAGKLSPNQKPITAPKRAQAAKITLQPAPAAMVPETLRHAICQFCEVNSAVLGVYAFQETPADKSDTTAPANDLRMVLWLRKEDAGLYHDFCLMAQTLVPESIAFFCKSITAEDKAFVKFLQGRPALWPVV